MTPSRIHVGCDDEWRTCNTWWVCFAFRRHWTPMALQVRWHPCMEALLLPYWRAIKTDDRNGISKFSGANCDPTGAGQVITEHRRPHLAGRWSQRATPMSRAQQACNLFLVAIAYFYLVVWCSIYVRWNEYYTHHCQWWAPMVVTSIQVAGCLLFLQAVTAMLGPHKFSWVLLCLAICRPCCLSQVTLTSCGHTEFWRGRRHIWNRFLCFCFVGIWCCALMDILLRGQWWSGDTNIWQPPPPSHTGLHPRVYSALPRGGHERPHERAHATHAENKPAHAELMSCRSCQFLAHVMPLMPQYISCHAAHAEIFAHIMPNTYHAAHAPHVAHVMPLMPKFMLAHVMPLMWLMLAHVCRSCQLMSC